VLRLYANAPRLIAAMAGPAPAPRALAALLARRQFDVTRQT
jgi:hypothetical protein